MVEDLNSVVDSYDLNHCLFREGFAFSSAGGPANILNAIVIRSPENCDCWSPKYSVSGRSLEETIAFINRHQLEHACIIAEDLSFLPRCQSLKYLDIHPANTAPESFDFSPLYEMPEIRYLHCATGYGGPAEPFHTTVDYSKVHGLRRLLVNGTGHLNYQNCPPLEELYVGDDKHWPDLSHLKDCTSLKRLWLTQCGTRSLEGIQSLPGLQELSADHCRRLTHIHQLASLSALRSLSIESCPQISDFSCLKALTNLEYLHLHGSNVLPDLEFLHSMKKLRVFTFSMNVLNCDLSPCLDVPYVWCEKGRKGYNLKDKDLPKGERQIPFELI